MGLTSRLRQFAAARPHLLVVEAPGGAAARLAVERFARERGWPLVDTPADADVLVVAGSSADLEEQVNRVWEQLPGPRAKVVAAAAQDVTIGLDQAAAALLDVDAYRRDVRRTERPGPGQPAADAGHDMAGMGGDAGHDMAGMGGGDRAGMSGHDMSGHAGHDMAGMSGHAGHDMADMSGHAGHDMAGMELPAGLAMANRAPDRDGLKLDVLTIPWGPVLPWWPPGLVVTTILQGDVVQQARVEQLGSGTDLAAGWSAAVAGLDPAAATAALRLDALVRLLAVAGWDAARLRCQYLRDGLLAGAPDPGLERALRRTAGQVSGSRVLARMTSGIATTRGEDVAARYRRWLAETVRAVTAGELPQPDDEPHVLHELPPLLTGLDVAGMRLVVASVGPALSGALQRAAAHA